MDPTRPHGLVTCQLLAVRHGQASFGSGNYDQLSALGVRQSACLGAWWASRSIRLDALWCGPLKRQIDTARHLVEVAAGLGCRLPPPTIVEEFRELAMDPLMQQVLPQLEPMHDPEPGPVTAGHRRAPGLAAPSKIVVARVLDAWANGRVDVGSEESFEHFEARIRNGLARVAASGGQVAVVTSAGPIAMTTRRALGLDGSQAMRLGFSIGNSAISEFRFSPDGMSLHSFNSLGHLNQDEITYI